MYVFFIDIVITCLVNLGKGS